MTALPPPELAAAPEPVRPAILVLRALGLGDLLAAVPALRALRRAFPPYEMVLAAPEELAPAAAATGAVDRLLPAAAPGRAVPRTLDWPGPPPEIGVDLHGNGQASHRLLRTVRPRKVLAFAAPDGPLWQVEEHERDRWCRFLRWYGIPADPTDLRLPHPGVPSPAPGAVVVHPGAGAPARCWPAERYAHIAAELRARGHRVVVTGGPDEEELVTEVAKRADLPETDTFAGPPAGPAGTTGRGAEDPAGVPASGGLSFPSLSALVAEARAVVSGDTGIAHLAVAHTTPSVTLFGPVPPDEWGPPRHPRHQALWRPDQRRHGNPHGRAPDPALLRIQPDDVLRALDEVEAPPGTREPETGSRTS
ncbi:glycosyltransferase family 9 protein [Streptomyces poonensis]|uniref:Glycosyltransferase family 9 protein n=1 Tax=Streptomyces poonensis TaxID=68255 RepID=A0A918Q3Z9_9ACTN|nr:glycosyltransferase family 9 protein [Streptomyces poonensis]GGZ32462.1 hypothetical protein GCM10010365_61600 [Streptomyces poonensis]GLJ92829.1 hypothetical protein GCM10017589_54390 [Streptomyces poonensis]